MTVKKKSDKKSGRTKKFKVVSIKVVDFHDLSSYLMENGGFDRPGYGDYGTETLAEPWLLIDELVRRDKGGIDGPSGHLLPLILELQSIPKGVMVNLG